LCGILDWTPNELFELFELFMEMRTTATAEGSTPPRGTSKKPSAADPEFTRSRGRRYSFSCSASRSRT
jgi:hypothetical protein